MDNRRPPRPVHWLCHTLPLVLCAPIRIESPPPVTVLTSPSSRTLGTHCPTQGQRTHSVQVNLLSHQFREGGLGGGRRCIECIEWPRPSLPRRGRKASGTMAVRVTSPSSDLGARTQAGPRPWSPRQPAQHPGTATEPPDCRFPGGSQARLTVPPEAVACGQPE